MKKIFNTFLLFVFMISAFTFSYEAISKPEVSSSSSYMMPIDNDVIEDNVSKSDKINKVNDNISSQLVDGNNLVLFYKKDNNDSIFLLDNVLPSLEKEYKLDSLNVKLVDISILGENFSNATLKREWGLDKVPTFQLINLSENNKNIVSSFTWDENDTVTIKSVEDWLLSIEYLKPLTITPKGVEIETPLSES